MGAVHLNRQLMLETREQVADGAGGYSELWTPLGSLWAEVTARTGRERAGEDVALAMTAYRIVVRAAPVGSSRRPRPGQRFREGPRVFAIQAVAERDAQGRFLTCYADEEVVA